MPLQPLSNMVEFLVTLQLLSIFAGTWFAWMTLKRVITGDPLSKILGPSPDSLATGVSIRSTILLAPNENPPILYRKSYDDAEQRWLGISQQSDQRM